jgi:hypothetical protein
MKNFFLFVGSLIAISLLVSCGGGDDAPEPAPTIAAPTVAGLFQPEGEIDVTFNITGTFQTGNSFIAQLSDGTGNFSNPTVIGTLASTAAGTIEATLPASVATGNAYRIRVVATTPATISPDNGSNLSIAPPTISITNVTTTGTFNLGAAISVSTTLTGTFSSCNSFTLQLSNAAGEFTSPVQLGTNNGTTLNATTQAVLPTNISAGVGYKLRWVSSCPVVTGTPSNAFEVKIQSLGVPTITGNLAAGGGVTVQVPYSNGSWNSGNSATVQLSDATGSFANPTTIRSLPTTFGTSGTQQFNGEIPVTTPAGAAYRIRTVTTNPQVTGAVSASFAIGALPTLTIAPGTPTFTKLYSGSGLFSTTYTMSVTRTSTINPNTTFRLQRTNLSTGVITETLLATTQASDLINNGSTTVFVTLLNAGSASVRFVLLANGHAIASNQLQMNVTQTGLNTLSGNIDAQAINFGTNKSVYSANTPTTYNNQEVLVFADEPTTVFGAASVRMFIGIPLVNENVSTGAITGRVAIHYLNSTGSLIAAYSNTSVSLSISGSSTAYTLSASGPFTLTRVSGTAGNSTVSLQSVSASFKMQ